MRRRLSIPFSDWPARDRKAWHRAVTPNDDLLSDAGAGAHLREETRVSYMQGWGGYLGALNRAGELDSKEGPAARLTQRRVRIYLADMRARGLADTTMRQSLVQLRAVGELLAQGMPLDHVTRPEGVPLRHAFPEGPRGFAVRDIGDVLPHVAELHRRALLMPEGPNRWRALRDTACMGLFLTRAPRKGSVAKMQLGMHLKRLPQGTWRVDLPGIINKTPRGLVYDLDEEVGGWMADYLALARGRFPRAATSTALWMGMKGPLGREGLSKLFEDRCFEWFGVRHGPHMARKWLRSSAAFRDPALAHDSALVMGHSAEVSQKHYMSAENLHASLRHADALAEERERTAHTRARMLEGVASALASVGEQDLAPGPEPTLGWDPSPPRRKESR